MAGTYAKLITQLESNGVEDWYLFFYCLFSNNNWGMIWSLKACCSSTAADIYASRKNKCEQELTRIDTVILEKKDEEYAKATGAAQSRWLNVYDHVERLKKRYVNKDQMNMCMMNMDNTLGYHPLSDICCGCPIKDMCSKNIYKWFQEISKSELDIIKLRGRIVSVSEAEKHLRDVGSEFDFYE